jgi:SPP1 gp7 family putative phage head morphogenesis protein
MKQRNPLKQDPSQTAMIRRAWVADVNRRFVKLRRDTRDYVLNDLGLTQNTWNPAAEIARWAGHVKKQKPVGTGRELADKIVAAHGKNKTSKLAHIVEAPIHLEHKIKDLAIGAAKGAISHLQDVVKAGGASALEKSKGPSPFAAKLGKGAKMVATAGLKIAYAPWIAGQAAVERVALAKGLSKEAAAKVRTIATGYDLIGCKAVFLGLEHAGFPGLAAKSMFIPTASTLYLAHATATNPIAVIKAAGKAIGDVKKMGVKGSVRALGKWLVNAATSAIDKVVGVLADAMQRHEGDDWYFALLTEAMGEADSVPDAVKMAERAYDQQKAPTTNAPFVFETDDKKLKRFRRWFQQQVDAGILEANPMSGEPKGMKPWMHKYVDSAYRKGLVRAYLSTHAPDLAKKMPYSEGSKEEFLRSSFGRPERVSKLQMLYTRTYEDLKGVTATMSTQMSRTLADGMAHGMGPMTIARNMTRTVDGLTRQRARVIARTETIAAHATGQLDGLADLGVKRVEAEVEWSTAGDDGVCPKCAKLEGKIFTIKEAEGKIPLHPNCRCSWLPVVRSAALGNLKKGK